MGTNESRLIMANAFIFACSTYGVAFYLLLNNDAWKFNRYSGLVATGILWLLSAGIPATRLLRSR